jgi:hypothetical protein
MSRNYYGLPVTLATEQPVVVARYAQSSSRGEAEIGRLGLTCMFIDSDPWWAAVIYQYGVPIAIVECIANQAGLIRGLAEDTLEKLRDTFGIADRAAGPSALSGLEELRKAQRAEADYRQVLWNNEHRASWDTRPPEAAVKPEPSVESLSPMYPAAAAYLSAERIASVSKTRDAGLKAMDRLTNGEDYKQVLADLKKDSMRASIPESAYYPGRHLVYGLSGPVIQGQVECSRRLSPSIEVTLYPEDPFHVAIFYRNGAIVLTEHCIEEYPDWLRKTENDQVFLAHVEQI